MKITLAASIPLAVGILLAVGVLVLVFLTGRGLGPAVPRRTRSRLLLLRLAAALVLVLLLLEPVLSRERIDSDSLSVVVLLDRSRSMAVPDSWRGRPRYQVASEFLNGEKTGLLPLIGDDFRVVPLAFDTSTRAATAAERAAAAPPRGNLTDLAGALRAGSAAVPKAETAAIVLLTDGAENGGGDARDAAREVGVPVFAVGFGSRAGSAEVRRDLVLPSVDAPDRAFLGNTVVVEASLKSTGYDLSEPGNRRVRVVLKEGEREIASEWAELTEEGVPVRVPLRFVPEGTGEKTYRVSVAVRGDEAIAENNSRTFSLNVEAHRAAVLYFDASLRWEAKFLRDFLARDPAIELTSVLHAGQGRLDVNGSTHGADLGHGLPATKEGFAKFDVIVLGDVGADVLAPGALGLLTARIEAGGGLLTLGGYHAYGAGGYAHTPLADVLPFLVSDGDGQRETALRLGLTPEGRVHPILSGLERELTSGRPPALEGLTRVGRAKPGAQVLLTGPGEEGRPPDIVLAAQRYGKGRVVSFTGDTSWRWFRSPEYGGPDGLYGRLWGQTIRWLLEREPEVEKTGDPVVLFTDRPVYRIGETVRIRARVSGPDGTPVSDATVEVRRTGPGGEERLALSPLPRVPGHYEVRVRAMRAGESGLAATASRNGSEIGTATGSYRVEDASIEMDNVDLDEDRLGAIAAASGGRYYHSPPTAEAVARDIRGTLAGLRRREETRLVNAPLFFLLFVLLTGGEWALRKRRNLL